MSHQAVRLTYGGNWRLLPEIQSQEQGSEQELHIPARIAQHASADSLKTQLLWAPTYSMRGSVAPAIRSTFAAMQRKRARSHRAAAFHLHTPRNTQILPTAWQLLAGVSHVRAARARAW
jgi:hypothetical protein